MNLGHPVSVENIAKHPLKRIDDYTSGKIGQRHITESDRPGHGVYGSFKDAQEGFSTPGNLDRWSGYASANTQVGPSGMKDSKPPSHADMRPGQRANQRSDGYLAVPEKTSKKFWAERRFGSDSAPGRLEKTHKR